VWLGAYSQLRRLFRFYSVPELGAEVPRTRRTTLSRRNARSIMIAAISERPEQDRRRRRQQRKDQDLSPCPDLAGHK
jgi:hypothetical protein